MKNKPGHWVLASMGKKVLRPGGRKATFKLLKQLKIEANDTILEIAPGMGYTAAITIKKTPKDYIAIDMSKKVVSALSKKYRKDERVKFINANAKKIPLEFGSRSVVYGEALLTMQDNKSKQEMINQAYAILKKGGRYGIHEIGLVNIENMGKKELIGGLQDAIKIPAQPLPKEKWIELFKNAGFKDIKVSLMPFNLMKKSTIITDEKFRTFKILWNLMTKKELRKRALQMKKHFDSNRDYMRAIVIVAKK